MSPKVGDYVYKPFEILKPGKITKVFTKTGPGYTEIHCEVKWLDGDITSHWNLNLNDFNHATNEHLNKYNKFEALRQKLKGL